MIQSVPEELNKDLLSILSLTEVSILIFKNKKLSGIVSVCLIITRLGWSVERSQEGLNTLTKEGIFWLDGQASPNEYHLAGLFLATPGS